jgi:acyl-CoA dehydrogenase
MDVERPLRDSMFGLFRTLPSTKENHRHGLTNFLDDIALPGISISPVHNMADLHEFNKVVFNDCLIPDNHVLGEIDGA